MRARSQVATTYGSDIDSNNDVHASRCCHAAELVHYGASHIRTGHALSPEFTAELAAQVRRDCHMAPEGPLDEAIPDGTRWHYDIYSTVHDGVRRLSNTTSR